MTMYKNSVLLKHNQCLNTVGTHYLDIALFDFSLSRTISRGPEFIPSYVYINFVFISTFHLELFRYLDLNFWSRFDILHCFHTFKSMFEKALCESKGVNNLRRVVTGVVIKSINSELFANPSCWIPDSLFLSAFNWQVSKLSD